MTRTSPIIKRCVPLHLHHTIRLITAAYLSSLFSTLAVYVPWLQVVPLAIPIPTEDLLTDKQGRFLRQRDGGGTAMMRLLSMATSFVLDIHLVGNPLGSSQAKGLTQ